MSLDKRAQKPQDHYSILVYFLHVISVVELDSLLQISLNDISFWRIYIKYYEEINVKKINDDFVQRYLVQISLS